MKFCTGTLLTFALLALTIAPAWPVDFQSVIDDCWSDDSPNSAISCYFTHGKWRGSKSRRDCVELAVEAAADGNPSSARGWLLACTCGMDREQRRAVELAAGRAVEYAVQRYGMFAR